RDKADAKNAENKAKVLELDTAKEEAKQHIDSLSHLTETEKEAFKKDVDSAKDRQQVKDIRDKADVKNSENKDKITPNGPTIDDYYATDDYARGQAKGASRVAIYVDGKFVRTTSVNEDGTYRIYTGDIVALQKEGAVFEIAARDAKGIESQRTQGTVLADQRPAAPTIDDYYATDAYAKGKAKGASRVAVYADGKFVRTTSVNEDGTYRIYTGDIVALQKEGAVFEIAARDAKGIESRRTQGTVLASHRPE
ncbi:Ig-like domain-containing protein, partial [Bacillus mycoides]|uniref:Ig-like domain-containing protein n=1 Tax=Bacillus mycoides TaxID=1405 RepID=UPI0038150FD1